MCTATTQTTLSLLFQEEARWGLSNCSFFGTTSGRGGEKGVSMHTSTRAYVGQKTAPFYYDGREDT